MSLSTLRARLRPLLAWLRSADGFAYLALMALALAVRLALAPNLMKSFDMGTYEYWGHLANIDLLHVYSLGGKGPNWLYYPNYPPVAIYFYGLIDKVVFGLAALLGLPLAHDVRHSSLLQVVFKLPGIIADLALLTILYVKALDALDRRWVVWLLCATYAISPGVLITVVFWGQTDGLVLLGVVVALFFALRRQPVWCGVLLALVVNFKPQPIVFAPLALVYLWRWGGFRMVVRGAIAFLGVTLLVWLPYLIPPFGELGALAHNVGVAQAKEGLAASRDGWNLWYALGVPTQSVSSRLIGPLTVNEVGYALFVIVILIAMIGVWRRPQPSRMWSGAAIIALAMFTVTPLQLERYLFPALGLFFLAALYDRRYWLIYGVVSVTFMANFGSEVLASSNDRISSRIPAHLHRVLLLHLDSWQGGVINCVALLLAIIYFLWPRVTATEQAPTMRATDALPILPTFGLSGPPGVPASLVAAPAERATRTQGDASG